ncbi:MFS transporter [Rhizobium sp. FKY42]|uniref:MFS transporter n=1 Tax=Rhizobium sp. FKY42 TaxID=2562310 RepID=UPI0010BFAAB3|nr:MFS transporter [Rhizobium sp. FKY42]
MTTLETTAAPPVHTPGRAQGVLLSLVSLCAVAAAILLTPVLPAMVAHYEPTTANAEAKVLFAMAVPALVLAICASFIGGLLDRYGRKKILVLGLILYGLLGILPGLVVVDINTLILLRVGLGACEAAIMTAASTMIGDYWFGEERRKWFVTQSIVLSVVAIFVIPLGGALGEISWNAPFWGYGLFLIAAPLAMRLLHEPAKHEKEPPAGAFPWAAVLGLYLFGFVLAVLVVMVPIQLPFIFTERGINSTLLIGLSAGTHSVGVLIGSVYFKYRAASSFKQNLAGAFAVAGLGIALLVGDGSIWMSILGAFTTGLGVGFLMPCLISQVQSHLQFEQRGRGVGRFHTFFFIGNFTSPLLVLATASVVGGLSMALYVMAGLAFTCTVLGLSLVRQGSAGEVAVVAH